jgi:hypothetical protein
MEFVAPRADMLPQPGPSGPPSPGGGGSGTAGPILGGFGAVLAGMHGVATATARPSGRPLGPFVGRTASGALGAGPHLSAGDAGLALAAAGFPGGEVGGWLGGLAGVTIATRLVHWRRHLVPGLLGRGPAEQGHEGAQSGNLSYASMH